MKKGRHMNKKDIQRLHEERNRTPEPASLPVPPPSSPSPFTEAQIADAVAKALENRMVDVRTRNDLVVKDGPWFQLYCSIVGGQGAWLASASTSALMSARLGILADVATNAANHAQNIKKIGK